jgi:hypothetical protein
MRIVSPLIMSLDPPCHLDLSCLALKTVSFDRLGFGPRHTRVVAEQKADADPGGPVKRTEELWCLLTALDTLIFCLAVAVIK